MVGLYKYDATTEEELSFEEGDTLTLYEQDDPDWFLVGNGTHVGFVPGNYIEVNNRILHDKNELLQPSIAIGILSKLTSQSFVSFLTRLLQNRTDKHRLSRHKSNTRKNIQLNRTTNTMNKNKLRMNQSQ